MLRRIPGLTIVDDRFVVVRGLAQRYNNVWLNKATTPSSETDSRAFSFDVLPSSLIDNMMVYKSPSAELPADFSGGFVQVMTKNIPDGNTFNVSYQMGFNTNATFRSFQLTDGSWKDYLGFGAGVRSLPSSFPSHLGDYSTEKAAAFTRRINQRWGINRFTAIPDQKISLTSHRSFDAGDWKIGNIANVNWSTGYDYSETVNNNYIAYDVANDLSRPRFEYNDVRYKNTSKLGALFNWSFMKGDHKYEFRNFFSQRGVSALTQRNPFIPDVRPIQGNLAARIRYRRISTKWTGLPAMLLLPIGNRTARSSIPSSTRRRRTYRITMYPIRCAITRT